MKKLLFAVLLITLSTQWTNAQEIISKKYYKTKYSKTKNKKKAKFIELKIREKNGAITYQTKEISSDSIVESYSYKDDVQYGIWITHYGETLNYDFEVNYGKLNYPDAVEYDIINKKLISEVNGNFDPPVFTISDNDFNTYIGNNVRYPGVAQENGEQGEVISQCIIDENGKIIDFSIIKSASKSLDKEVERTVLGSSSWSPAKIDNKPVKTIITIKTKFTLL